MTPAPNSLESESALLGAVLRDPDACSEFLDEFTRDDFYHFRPRVVWSAVQALRGAGSPIDIASVSQQIRADGFAADVPSLHVAELWEAVPTAANASYHAGVVRDYALRRRVLHAALEVAAKAQTVTGSSEELLEEARAAFRDVRVTGHAEPVATVGDLADEAFRVILEKHKNGTSLDGLSTGLVDLDKLLGGLKPGELVVIGARPSQGKTALGLGVAYNIAGGGAPALLFSAEMPGRQIAERVLARESEVDTFLMSRPGRLTPEFLVKLDKAAAHVRGTPLYIDDRPDISAARIFRTAKRVKKTESLAVVVVDYLQLLRAEPAKSRHEEVGTLALRMKQLARELEVPVILLSQLSRESEKNGEPTLAHLKESGDIEAHADRVILIHRTGDIPDLVTLPVEARLIVAKNRNGPVGKADVVYNRTKATFENKEKAR